MYRIVVDGAGTDKHPYPEIEGSLKAVEERKDVEIILVIANEDIDKVPKHLPDRINIYYAEDKVSTNDKPSYAISSKKNSTIALGLNLMNEKKTDAFVSAGNTGAVMAFSLKTLGRLKGVKRPCICALFPALKGFCGVLDVGANVDSKPLHLVQFGVMGYLFVKHILEIENPKIALLSIGEEETKGNEQVLQAKKLFEKNKIPNFIGYVEGKDIMKGVADVVVVDGFTGNSILKFGEGAVEFFIDFLKKEIQKSLKYKIGAYLLKNAFKEFKTRVDFEQYGGAPLLGINGTVVICHGRSSEKAIKNAIFEAIKFIRERVNEKIEEKMGKITE